jgi:predicted peptidase
MRAADSNESQRMITEPKHVAVLADFGIRWNWPEICLLSAMAALVVQVFPDGSRLWPEWPREGQQVFARAELSNVYGQREKVDYLIYYPQGYFKGDRWPLLIYLHGSGQRGHDLNQVLSWGLPLLIEKGLSLPIMVVSPQCRANRGWDSNLLLSLTDHLEQRFAIDRDRIYVCGESMGGYGTWALTAAAPDRFAAAVPICGGGKVENADRLTKLPIWSFHGGQDNVVPIAKNQKMVEAVRENGGDVRFTIFSDQGHGITEAVFSRGDLFTWLLAQQRRN